ncbi:MAG: AAA family ATPase [Bradyrhizobium sp.]|nr:MAG: AAA family ATPase [Bradyrhizobium sp.]
MHSYELWILRRYLANALRSSRLAKPPRADADFVTWIENHARLLALPDISASVHSTRRRASAEALMHTAHWKAWRAAVIGMARSPAPNPSPLQKRLNWLAGACLLSQSQNSALGLLARATQSPQFRSLIDVINDRLGLDLENPDEVDLHHFSETNTERTELSAGGRLAELGLVEARESLRLSLVVRRLLSLPRFAARRVSDLLLGEPARASLEWSDFEHLGDLRDLAARIVATAGRSRDVTRRGINVLLYGPPGTGKSEFAKTLGARLGFSVQFCGETNDENAEPNRRERIAALLIANAIGGVARKTIIVVDEADDLFAGFEEDGEFGRRGSRVFMNRLLERATAPTIWITNDVHRLGPAIVRRMNLAIRFSRPALSVRKAMVARIVQGAGFRLDERAALDLARSPAPPALIENAIRSSTHIRGSAADAHIILASSVHALGVREAPRAPAPLAFDPALSSADVDLAVLADQVVCGRERALSFCLSGPPGTGKSAYARYLAERLDMEVLEKRFSDLSSMYLGESEKAIAAAFEEAADSSAFLVLDEADSLLRDRAAAHYSWEVTQVNEMLTSIERHVYPFALTTNAPDILDPAMARRILFKVRFLPMTREQIAAAFRSAFGGEAPVSVLGLSGLTPGDLATVARRGAAIGERNLSVLAKWLEDEAFAKPAAGSRKIGF